MKPQSDFSIRRATERDAGTVHDLVCALARFLGQDESVASQPADFARFGPSGAGVLDTLIAERDGRAVGLCNHFPVFSSWRGRPGVFILDLYVDETERGTGLGKALLAQAVRLGKAQGATFVQLAVHDNNGQAIGYYQRLGLSAVGGEKVYQADGAAFDALGEMNA